MPKPKSIRTATWVLYFIFALSLLNFLLSLRLFLAPSPEEQAKIEQLSSAQITAAFISMLLPVFASLLVLWFIRRKKRMPALILSLVLVYFSSGDIYHLVLGVTLIFLLFLRSSKEYFADGVSGAARKEREKAVEPVPAGPAGKDEQGKALPSPESHRPKADPAVEIRQAGAADAETVHRLMLAAFEEYRAAAPPSSALEETVESVRDSLQAGQGAAILYEDDTPAAMVRYEISGDTVTFFRLSVLPARRRRGYARRLIKWIERLGVSKGLERCRCKVRQTVQNNLAMYQDMGYEIVDQELVIRPTGSVKALTLEKKLGI